MRRIRAALVALTLTLLVSASALAYAAPGGAQDRNAPSTAATMFDSPTQEDGTVADDLILAFVSTLAGVAFVSFIFVARRKES